MLGFSDGTSQSYVDSLYATLKPHPLPSWDEELLRLTRKDIDRGSGEGLFGWRDMDARYGVNKWRPIPRYVIQQQNKYRAIDNSRASGHNNATILRERVHTTSLEFFASACKQFLTHNEHLQSQAEQSHQSLTLEVGVDDEEDAYRKYATADYQPYITMSGAQWPSCR